MPDATNRPAGPRGRILRRLLTGARDLWLAALRERASPRRIAAAIALGVFVGCTPLIGAHAGIALAAATVCRLNRLWAVVGSRVSFFLILPWIVLAEIETSHRLRTGAWAPLSAADALAHKREWLLDWCMGTLPVGLALALALGGVAYLLAARREALTQRKRARSPRPSLESPPSG